MKFPYVPRTFGLGLFLFAVSSFAESGFHAPEFCAHYDQVYGIKNSQALTPDGNTYTNETEVSSQCVGGTFVGINIDDIMANWNKVNDNFLILYADRFQQEVNKKTIDLLAKRANSYEGLSGSDVGDLDDELLGCLRDIDPGLRDTIVNDRIAAKRENNQLTPDYIGTSFDKSLLVSGLFSVLESTKVEFENEKAALKAKKKGLSDEAYNSQLQALEESFGNQINAYHNSLRQLSVASPLLFTTQNDFKFLDWFDADLAPSKLQKQLVGEVPRGVLRQIKASLKNPETLSDFSEFREVTNGPLKEQIFEYKNNHLKENKADIDKELKSASKDFSEQIYSSMKKNCKDGGQYLHFNQEVVALVAEDIFKKEGLSPEEKKAELIALQAWQCQAWRDRPPKDVGEFNWSRIGGLASIGLGAAMWLTAPFTGVGAIAGTWLMGIGGAALTANEVADFVKFNPTYHQQKTAYHLGWKDLHDFAKASDQRTDIISNIGMEATIGMAGAGLRLVRLPGKLSFGKVAKNNKTRDSGDPVKDVENYHGLIMSRHERIIPEENLVDKTNRVMRAVTGNREVPKILLKEDGDFAPMLKILTDTKGKAVDRDLAFEDLQSRIKMFKNYPDRIKDAVRTGRNSQEILNANKVYGSVLRAKHFKRDPKTGAYPDLPEVPEGMKLTRTKNDSVALSYRIVQKGEDGTEQIVEHVEDFVDYDNFITFVSDTKKAHKMAFSFDIKDEVLRKSDIFSELDTQARLYRELDIVRDSLIKVGKNVDPQTGKYPNLTERQNGYIFQLNEILKDSPELLPRRDAYRAFSMMENKAERRAMVLGNIFKSRSSKYSKEAQSFTNERLPSMVRTLAPIGLFSGTFGGTGIIVTSASDRFGARGLVEDFKDAMRDVSRKYNSIFYPEAPFGFTNDEKKCAQEARAWSVENVCLLDLLSKQVMVRAGIREQLDPNYDMIQDPQLMREVRDYIRKFYRLRNFFAEGKKTQVAQTAMREVADELAEEELTTFVRDVALQNGLILLDEGFISDDKAGEFRRKLFNYRDDPEGAKEAYQQILSEYEKFQGGLIQNPEMSPQLKNLIESMILDQARIDSEG
jgi:hypothetical protein